MYRLSFMIFLFYLLFALTSCSKKPLHTCKVLESSDSQPKAGSVEWIDKLQYNNKYKLSYGIFNEQEHLVVRMMVTDRTTISKMFAAGFTITIDTTGKKESHFAVKYPLPQGMPEMDQIRGQQNAGHLKTRENVIGDKMKKRFETALNQIELFGFSEDALNNTVLNSRKGSGITAWIIVDSTATMHYEVRLPLAGLFPAGLSESTQFSVGFESGELDISPPNGNTNRMSAGMDRPRSGAHPNGGNRPDAAGREARMTQMQAMSTPVDFWVKRIAFKK